MRSGLLSVVVAGGKTPMGGKSQVRSAGLSINKIGSRCSARRVFAYWASGQKVRSEVCNVQFLRMRCLSCPIASTLLYSIKRFPSKASFVHGYSYRRDELAVDMTDKTQ